MKKQKLLAALLCFAMAVTSLGTGVSAAATDILVEDTGSITEESTAVTGDTLVEETVDESLLVEEAAAPEADDEKAPATDKSASAPEESVSGNKLTADKRVATPFDETAPTLTLKGYDSLKDWDYDSVIIPACVTTIPASEDLFQGNEKIKTVEFESTNTLTTIEAGAFLNSGITTFTLPRSVKTIEESTFQGCTGLMSFVLNEVETIGDSAFKDCKSLTNSGFSGGTRVVEIGDFAFQNTGFTTVTLNGMTKTAITVGKGIFADCVSLTRAELPSGFLTVPEKCFSGCDKLEEVTIGNRTLSVETEAFKNCKSLRTVNFGNVESIKTRAFDGCSKIQTIDLPVSVYEIEEQAFYICENLTKLYIRYKNSKTGIADDIELTGDLVYYPSKLTIYGNDGLVEKYATDKNIKFESLLTKFTVKFDEGCEGYVSDPKFARVGSGKYAKSITAVKGETIGFQFTTKSPWTVIKVYDSVDEAQETVIPVHAANNGGTHLFSFTMPNRDCVIKVAVVHKDVISKGTAKYDLTGFGFKYVPEYKDGKIIGYRTQTTGNKAQLNVYITYQGKDYQLGYWLVTYRSADKKIATIDAKGVITAISPGAVMIGYKPEGQSEQAFSLYVSSEATVDKMDFDLDKLVDDFEGERYGEVTAVTRSFIENGEKVTRIVPLIRYYRTDLASTDRLFDIHLIALDKGGAEVNINATWSVDDKTIAKTANTSNYDNVNTITVLKGTSGETYIKASITSNKVTKYAYAVLQVLDPAPRATANSYMVNTQCIYVADYDDEAENSDGALVEIIASEGYDIDPEKMGPLLYTSESVNDTSTFKGIKVTYVGKSKDDERGFLYRLSVIEGKYGDARINALKEGQSITFKDNSKLFMRGQFASAGVNDGLANDYYYVPLKSLTVFNQKLKPTVTQTGSINIFYNANCYEPENNNFEGWEEVLGDKAKKDTEDEKFESNKFFFINYTIGEIAVLQSYPKKSVPVDYYGVYRADEYGEDGNKEIRDYVYDIAGGADKAVRLRLMSEKNYAYFIDNTKYKQKEEKDGKYFDSFANNFTLEESTSGKDFRIRRSANPMAQINGQDVTSGYLLIYYKGYKDPIAYKLDLKVKNSGPSYTLSPQSANDSWLNYTTGNENNTVFDVGLFLKKGAKSVLQEDDMADGYPYVDQNTSTRRTGCVFNKAVTIGQYRDTETNAFKVVKNQTYTGKAKANIVVKKTWWDKELRYTFTVSESDKAPTGKFSPAKIELNKRFVGESNERSTLYKVNMGPCTVSIDGDISPLPTKKQSEDEFDKLTVTAEPEGEGTQTLLVKAYINDESIEKGKYTYQITPIATFAKSDVEMKAVKFTVNVTDTQPTAKLTNSTFKFNVDYPGVETYKVNVTFGKVPKGGKNEDFELDAGSAELVPTAKEGTDAHYLAETVAEGFSITKFEYNEKTKKFDFFCKLDDVGQASFNCKYNLTGLILNGAELKPVKVTLSSHHGVPSISLSGADKINTVDPFSKMTIKPTIKNLVNPDIEEIKYIEWDKDAKDYVTNDRFVIEKETDDDKDTTLCYITASHKLDSKGKDTCTNENHKVILKYTIGGHDMETAAFNIKPVQTTPKITIDPTSVIFYNNSEPESRIAIVEVTKTSTLNALINTKAKSGGFKVSDKNSAELKNAFDLEYSDENAEDVPPASQFAKTLKAGNVTIKCVAPELLIQGKTYTLILEPEWEGQFENTVANTVTVKVTVK